MRERDREKEELGRLQRIYNEAEAKASEKSVYEACKEIRQKLDELEKEAYKNMDSATIADVATLKGLLKSTQDNIDKLLKKEMEIRKQLTHFYAYLMGRGKA